MVSSVIDLILWLQLMNSENFALRVEFIECSDKLKWNGFLRRKSPLIELLCYLIYLEIQILVPLKYGRATSLVNGQ